VKLISLPLSTMSVNMTPQLSELPPSWLVLLFRHVASGPGGLASSAALSQTCKHLHGLSEGPAVTYSNIIVAAVISSPDHPAWQWLAKRNGRMAGLRLKLRVGQNGNQRLRWMQPLETLSSIPNVQLRVHWVGIVADLDHPCIAQWLEQHGQLISHLTVELLVSESRLKLKDFSKAAAPCKSLDLTITYDCNEEVDLAALTAVAGSLRRLTCQPEHSVGSSSLKGTSILNSMSRLTALHLSSDDLGNEEPWALLANLRGLQRLYLTVGACGDPSPLSALTGLTYLNLRSFPLEDDDQAPFSFTSLQPLSTLQQLEVLHLGLHACAATSLQGLAGLSNLKQLGLEFRPRAGSMLRSLEGISSGVIDLSIRNAPNFGDMAGIEACSSVTKLSLHYCGALQPLRGLTSLKHLVLLGCSLTSLESLDLTTVPLQSLALSNCSSLTSLAGVEHLSALKSLQLLQCGVTSLQPLSQLGKGLRKLSVGSCMRVQEEVLELPHVQSTADVVMLFSNVREVVLGGGVRRVQGHPK
jgi:Leucine-rich repeat (LRR) protein